MHENTGLVGFTMTKNFATAGGIRTTDQIFAGVVLLFKS